MPKNLLEAINERHPDPIQIFIGGSYVKGGFNDASDIDIIAILPKVPGVIRDVFIYEDKLIDLTAHDSSSFEAQIKLEHKLASRATAASIYHAIPLLPTNAITLELKKIATAQFHSNPPDFDSAAAKAYLLGKVDDLKYSDDEIERLLIGNDVMSNLLIFYLRSHGHWIGSNRCTKNALRNSYVELTHEILKIANSNITTHKGCLDLIELTEKIIIEVTGDTSKAWKKIYPVYKFQ